MENIEKNPCKRGTRSCFVGVACQLSLGLGSGMV